MTSKHATFTCIAGPKDEVPPLRQASGVIASSDG